MASGPIASWRIDGEMETVADVVLGAPKSLQMVIVAMKLRCLLLGTEKAMASHSSTLAWKIPWTGRLQSMGSLRIRHDWATSLSLFTSCIGKGNGNPLQCSCLENSRDGGAWWAAVYGVAQSRTRLKRLSSSSSTFSDGMHCKQMRKSYGIIKLGIWF